MKSTDISNCNWMLRDIFNSFICHFGTCFCQNNQLYHKKLIHHINRKNIKLIILSYPKLYQCDLQGLEDARALILSYFQSRCEYLDEG